MSLPHSVSRREILQLGGLIVSFALPMRLMAAGSTGIPRRGEKSD